MSDAEFARLWSQVDDLPLVFKVDLLHWDRLANSALKDKIRGEGFQGDLAAAEALAEVGVVWLRF